MDGTGTNSIVKHLHGFEAQVHSIPYSVWQDVEMKGEEKPEAKEEKQESRAATPLNTIKHLTFTRCLGIAIDDLDCQY